MMSARRGDGKRKRGTNKETEKKNGNVGNKKWRVTKPQQDKETEEYLKEKRNLEYLWKAAFPFKELVEERVRVGKVAHQAARDRRSIERMRRLATRPACL
ncbi:hypothetical protein YC2023_118007 [Brassica napus]|uniref:(rape) hypothetical protein n=1 Tax=Brassica napus TaxID=3708 RepID=A0A816J6L5_BRANA|nr:unnamed protein product [Brassica napus]